MIGPAMPLPRVENRSARIPSKTFRRRMMLYDIRVASMGRANDTIAAGTARMIPDMPVYPGNIRREADRTVATGSGTFKAVNNGLQECTGCARVRAIE